MPVWISCREFVEFLADYLSNALSPDRAAEFEYHLSGCPPCVAYLKSYGATVRLGKEAFEASDQPVSDEVPEGLVQAILAARPRR
jgi:anti-sigma factor RsiW